MNRDIDLIFEQSMCDSWWMQDNGIVVQMLYAQQRGVERLGLYAMRDTSGPIVHKQGSSKHGPVYFWGRDTTPV